MLRILIPTDFSSNALCAASYAVQLFGKREATYILMHAHYDAGYAGGMGYSMGPELLKASQEGLALAAKRFAESTGADHVEQEVLFGFLSTVVNDFVKEDGAAAVVMGKRGETGSALFGSNTTAVIHDCPVPVVAVPDQGAPAPAEPYSARGRSPRGAARRLGLVANDGLATSSRSAGDAYCHGNAHHQTGPERGLVQAVAEGCGSQLRGGLWPRCGGWVGTHGTQTEGRHDRHPAPSRRLLRAAIQL
ncbi:MAG: universal stress protein [Flavobacteriales bacterium]|nr:universal stress protein [Flavobacteriales bacterium]